MSTRVRVASRPWIALASASGVAAGCAVTFTRIWRGTIDPADNQEKTDWKVQLELLKQVDPTAASRLEAGAPKG